jgi:hypothetical protein
VLTRIAKALVRWVFCAGVRVSYAVQYSADPHHEGNISLVLPAREHSLVSCSMN